jgi:DNA-binding response OmpR family regulator
MCTGPFIHASDESPASAILIVDDEKPVRDLLERLLTSKGFQVSTTGDSIDALLAIKREKPNLILLDIHMPGMDGMQVLKAIREIDQSTRIMMLAAATDLDGVEEAIALGANGYLLKPFD